MRLFFGTTLVGDVDQVDDLKVTTLFVHCMAVPLVPMRSFLMRDDREVERVPLSIKSVFAAWLRTFLVVVGGFFALGALARLLKGNPDAVLWAVPALLLLGLFRWSRRWFRAGRGRAADLRALSG